MLPGRQEYPLYYEMAWNGFAHITHHSSCCLQTGSRSHIKHIWLRYWAFIFSKGFWLTLLVLYRYIVSPMVSYSCVRLTVPQAVFMECCVNIVMLDRERMKSDTIFAPSRGKIYFFVVLFVNLTKCYWRLETFLTIRCFIDFKPVRHKLRTHNCKWWPTRFKYFGYLFIPNQLHMFRAMCSPIIRSTWLYLQHLILSTGIAAGWCHGWDGTAVPSHPWHQPAAIPVDNINSCK